MTVVLYIQPSAGGRALKARGAPPVGLLLSRNDAAKKTAGPLARGKRGGDGKVFVSRSIPSAWTRISCHAGQPSALSAPAIARPSHRIASACSKSSSSVNQRAIGVRMPNVRSVNRERRAEDLLIRHRASRPSDGAEVGECMRSGRSSRHPAEGTPWCPPIRLAAVRSATY